MLKLNLFKKSKTIRLKKEFLTIASLRDPIEPWKTIKPSEKSVFVPTHQGVRNVTPSLFMSLVCSIRPSIIVPLYDLISNASPQSRKRKAVKRTAEFFDECQKDNCNVLFLFI